MIINDTAHTMRNQSLVLLVFVMIFLSGTFCEETLLRTTRTSIRNPRQAYLELILYAENGVNGGFITTTYQMKGKFAKSGTHFGAEGRIIKVDTQNFCHTSDLNSFDHPYTWIAFIQVSPTATNVEDTQCLSTVEQVEHVLRQGAKAVLIYSAKNKNIHKELESLKVFKPVVMVTSSDAYRINILVKKRKKNFIRIKSRTLSRKVPLIHRKDIKDNEYFDMGIFMAFFIVVLLICLIFLIKIKWRQKRKKNSRTKIAVEALKSMRIRKYNGAYTDNSHVVIAAENHDNENLLNCSFGIKSCAVCLDELSNGKDIRILPCHHEFHQKCIDPWLIANFTCPLCMYSILGTKKLKHKPRRTGIIPAFITRKFRTRNSLSATSSNSQEPSTESQNNTTRVSTTDTLFPTNYLLRNCNGEYKQQPLDSEYSNNEHSSIQTFRFHRCPFHNKKRTLNKSMNTNTSDTMTSQTPYNECSFSISTSCLLNHAPSCSSSMGDINLCVNKDIKRPLASTDILKNNSVSIKDLTIGIPVTELNDHHIVDGTAIDNCDCTRISCDQLVVKIGNTHTERVQSTVSLESTSNATEDYL